MRAATSAPALWPLPLRVAAFLHRCAFFWHHNTHSPSHRLPAALLSSDLPPPPAALAAACTQLSRAPSFCFVCCAQLNSFLRPSLFASPLLFCSLTIGLARPTPQHTAAGVLFLTTSPPSTPHPLPSFHFHTSPPAAPSRVPLPRAQPILLLPRRLSLCSPLFRPERRFLFPLALLPPTVPPSSKTHSQPNTLPRGSLPCFDSSHSSHLLCTPPLA